MEHPSNAYVSTPDTSSTTGPSANGSQSSGPTKARYAKALYDFVGHQVEELSLEEEDVVSLSVGVHVRGGWMYGEVGRGINHIANAIVSIADICSPFD